MQGSQLDADQAARVMKLIEREARAYRRAIPYAIVYIRTSAAIRGRDFRHIEKQLGEMEMIERAAFRAVFQLGGTLYDLQKSEVNNPHDAIGNAEALTEAVVAFIDDKAPVREGAIMGENRKRGSLDGAGGSEADKKEPDFSGFKPRAAPHHEPVEPARRTAGESGFTARHAPPEPAVPQVDGRRLRAIHRTAQLNISVKPETKDRFWTLAHASGDRAGEDFLKRLRDHFINKEDS